MLRQGVTCLFTKSTTQIAADKQEKKAQEAEAVAGDEDEKEKKDEDAEKEEEAKSGGVLGAIKGFGLDTCFLQPYFIPLMQNRITQIVGVALAMCLFIWAVVSLSVIYPLTFGLDMTDLTPRGSYTSKGFSVCHCCKVTKQTSAEWTASHG